MAKLYYKYGAMGSGKTTDLIKTYYNYKGKKMNVIIIKSCIDKKAGNNIQTRGHEELKVDYVVGKDMNLYTLIKKHNAKKSLDCILIDESQFLTSKQVDELTDVVDLLGIPVLCYGLRADAFTHSFEGSQRLFEVADVLEELKAVCKCGKKATHNIRFESIDNNLIPIFDGPQVVIDNNAKVVYDSVCRNCYKTFRSKYENK